MNGAENTVILRNIEKSLHYKFFKLLWLHLPTIVIKTFSTDLILGPLQQLFSGSGLISPSML